MANLKKEVMSLISRFDAAQEAFTANSTDVKKLAKKHKKELKSAKKEAKDALVEVEALKAEVAILKIQLAEAKGAPAKKTTARRGRPAKKSTTSTAKKGPGRPKKATTTTTTTTAKRGPGRPKKTADAPVAKKGPGRPKKTTTASTAKKSTAAGAKKGPGRPRTKPATPKSPLEAINGVGPAMAKHFEAAGVKTPAAMAKLSNVKMAAILEKCGPRYRNADAAKMDAYRKAATAAK